MGEGEREPEIHDLLAKSAKDSETVRDLSTSLGSATPRAADAAEPLSLVTPRDPPSTKSLTLGVDREVGIQDRGRSMSDFRRARTSGRAAAGASTVMDWGWAFLWAAAAMVAFLGPGPRIGMEKSESRSNEGMSKAGRLGSDLQLRVRWWAERAAMLAGGLARDDDSRSGVEWDR